LATILALVAAAAFAVGNVLQQKGTLQTSDGEGHPSFLVQILREPIWLFGGLAQVAGWVLQAVALDKGPLVLVQSVTTLSLVIALPLGAWLTKQILTPKVIIGAGAVVLGIVVFLAAGSPTSGISNPSASAWWSACLVTLALVVTLGLIGKSRKGARRALFFGAAAGFGFGLQSAVTKQFVGETGHGLASLLGDWSIYVLVVSALVGFVLQQSALKTGVLAPAIASSNVVTLFAGVLLGITVFNESLSHGVGHVVPVIVGLVATLAGVVLLASAPGTEESGVIT
jgi:drug/metabolite transporter (DMT)-like permease